MLGKYVPQHFQILHFRSRNDIKVKKNESEDQNDMKLILYLYLMIERPVTTNNLFLKTCCNYTWKYQNTGL